MVLTAVMLTLLNVSMFTINSAEDEKKITMSR